MRQALLWATIGALSLPAHALAAGDLLKTNDRVWTALTEAERAELRSKYIVDVADSQRHGVIVDAQAADESTAGATGGSALGQALGSATYVDRAFKGPNWNYSATGHLGAALLGGVIGSALDTPARRQFRFRYTVKDLAGNIIQTEQVSDQPFRQPAGVCVAIPSLVIVPSYICETDVVAFRARHLHPVREIAPSTTPAPATKAKGGGTSPTNSPPPQAEGTVRCRIGAAGIVNVSRQQCINAEGEIL